MLWQTPASFPARVVPRAAKKDSLLPGPPAAAGQRGCYTSWEGSYRGNMGEMMIHLQEIASQPYDNCTLSAGLVTGIEPDTIYLMLEREEDYTIYLREDEAISVIWLLSSALWSASIAQLAERRACTAEVVGSMPATGSDVEERER